MAVLEGIVQGRSLREAGVDASFLLQVAKSSDLGLVFAKAREMSSYALEEEALDRLRAVVADGKATATQLRAIDLLVQQLRWSGVKRNPNVYSEKAAVHITVPIQINTSLDLGDGATTGTKEFPNIYEAVASLPATIPLEQVADHLDAGGSASSIQYGGATLAGAEEIGAGPSRDARETGDPGGLREVREAPPAPDVRTGEGEEAEGEPRAVEGEAPRKRARRPSRVLAQEASAPARAGGPA